jgi:ArsR family transcriptional regulator, arsenate/arsenite/antimonite-responsive transcriptional repressor / arsenate reductase (thioredoxin)
MPGLDGKAHPCRSGSVPNSPLPQRSIAASFRSMEQHVAKLSALAHPQRLAVFRLLMRRYPDRVPAGEIGTILGLRPSTLSGYLSELAEAGMIEQERRGTSLRYTVVPEAAEDLVDFLVFDCCRARTLPQPPARSGRLRNVLFVSSGNAVRSLMAEAMLRRHSGHRFEAFSAGTEPLPLADPQAIAMLYELGHKTEGLAPKPTAMFREENAPRMDFVITICKRAANADTPAWPSAPLQVHWAVPDPVIRGTPEAFAEAYLTLRDRIEALAALPADAPRADLQRALDRIATIVADPV